MTVIETLNKLGANVQTITRAEKKHFEMQQLAGASVGPIDQDGRLADEAAGRRSHAHVDLAA